MRVDGLRVGRLTRTRVSCPSFLFKSSKSFTTFCCGPRHLYYEAYYDRDNDPDRNLIGCGLISYWNEVLLSLYLLLPDLRNHRNVALQTHPQKRSITTRSIYFILKIHDIGDQDDIWSVSQSVSHFTVPNLVTLPSDFPVSAKYLQPRSWTTLHVSR